MQFFMLLSFCLQRECFWFNKVENSSSQHCELRLNLHLYLLGSQPASIWDPLKSISRLFCMTHFLLIDSRSTEETCLWKCDFHGFNIYSNSGFTLQGGTYQTSQLWLFVPYEALWWPDNGGVLHAGDDTAENLPGKCEPINVRLKARM